MKYSLSRIKTYSPPDLSDKSAGTLLSIFLLALLLLKFFHVPQGSAISNIAYVAILAGVSLIIFRRPYWGIIITAAVLPISELFSSLASQPVILFGAFMIPLAAGMIFNSRVLKKSILVRVSPANGGKPCSGLQVARFDSAQRDDSRALQYPDSSSLRSFRFSSVHIAALCFIVWVFISHPRAAMARDGNYSIWHLLPLFFLMLASSVLLDTTKKQLLLIRSFVLTSLVSAAVALTHYRIGPTSAESLRASGLTWGPGIASIMFLVAIAFALHHYRSEFSQAYHIWGVTAVAVLVAGIVATVSRTTVVALPLVFGLAYLFSSRENSLEQLRRLVPLQLSFPINEGPVPHQPIENLKRYEQISVGAALSVSIVPITLILVFQQDYIALLLGIPESISHGVDSIGFRYLQWQNAWEMFLANPILGVGIGRFTETLPFFGQHAYPQYGINYSPHSIYMSLLAETGVVGFLLYAWLIAAVGQRLWRNSNSANSIGFACLHAEVQQRSGTQAWIFALAIFLFTGLTGDLQFNKLLWILIGIAASNTADDHGIKPSQSFSFCGQAN